MDCLVQGQDVDEPICYYKEEMRKIAAMLNNSTGNSLPHSTDYGINDEKIKKLDIYNKICETMVAHDILRKHIQAAVLSCEAFFLFR